jgi:hypothetical protein
MGKANNNTAKNSPNEYVFQNMGTLLKRTATAMADEKTIACQLSQLSQHFENNQEQLTELDSSSTANWLDEISHNACIGSAMLEAFTKQNMDLGNLRLDMVDTLIQSMENLGQNLSQGAFSLRSVCALTNVPEEKQELMDKANAIEQQFTNLSNNIEATTFGMRYFTGLDPEDVEQQPDSSSHCACCNGLESQNPELALQKLCTDKGIHTRLGGEGENLGDYISELEIDLETLKDAILALAVFLLWLASQPYLATNAGGRPCDDECTKSNNLVGATVTNVSAEPLQGSTRTFQPQCYVDWDYCCTNWCLLFYWENFIKTVTTGPHKLGGQVRLTQGQSATAAKRVANTRGAAFRPSVKLAAPAKPSC